MGSTSEIEKLERRYAENPHGLTFAPLAEAYRRNGDIDNALETLVTGLELHPDYTPASIVLGRCHLDRGNDAEAEAAFHRVLGLDPENVIALKALADIAERRGAADEAVRWLTALLAVDRTNEEAREQLTRLENAATEPATPDAAASVEPPNTDFAPVEVESSLDDDVDAGTSFDPGAAADFEPLDLEPASAAAGIDSENLPEPGEVPDPEPTLEPTVESALEPTLEAALEPTVEAALEPTLEPTPEVVEPDETRQPVLIERASEVSFDDSLISVDTGASDGSDAILDPSSDVLGAPADALDAQPEPMELEVFEPAEAASTGDLEFITSEPASPPFVATESLAELYLRQGHHAEALQVYRELVARNPDEPRLRERVAELERARDERLPSEPGGGYAAAQTGGQSVRDLFESVLAARPPMVETPVWVEPAPGSDGGEAADASPPEGPPLEAPNMAGEPTRPADDHLSLNDVFGDEGPAPMPAAPRPGTPADGASPGGDGLSFDEFFGAPQAEPSDATRTVHPHPDEAGDDDLDQFHTWLQKLKR